MLAHVIMGADMRSPQIALPTMATEFGVPMSTIQWVPLVYQVTVIGVALSVARLGDRFGRRRFHMVGLALMGVGALLLGTSASVIETLAFRVITALGAAIVFTNGKAFAAVHFAPDVRTRVAAAASSCFNGGALLGFFLGGVAIDTWGWRWVFRLVVPLALVGMALALGLPRDDKRKVVPVDLIGTVLLTVSALLLLLGLQTITRGAGWHATAMLVGSLIVGAFFLMAERASQAPLLDTRLFSNGPLMLGVGSYALVMATQGAVVFLVPFCLQDAFGYTGTQVGRVMLVLPAVIAVGMPLATALFRKPVQQLTERTGLGSPRARSTVGALILLLSMLGLVLATNEGNGVGIGIAVGGVGVGWQIFMPPNFNVMLAAVPAASIGAVNGIVVATTNIAYGIGVSTASLTLTHVMRFVAGSTVAADRSQWVLHRALTLPAFRATWMIISIFALGATLLAAKRPRPKAPGDSIYAVRPEGEINPIRPVGKVGP